VVCVCVGVCRHAWKDPRSCYCKGICICATSRLFRTVAAFSTTHASDSGCMYYVSPAHPGLQVVFSEASAAAGHTVDRVISIMDADGLTLSKLTGFAQRVSGTSCGSRSVSHVD
jgi:hypothetical protein